MTMMLIPANSCRCLRNWVRKRHRAGCVEGGGRFVEQQHRRIGRQCAGDRDPLRLTAGELARPAIGVRGDVEPFEPVVGTRRGLPARTSARPRAERDVVERAEVREEQVILKHVADVALMARYVLTRRRTGACPSSSICPDVIDTSPARARRVVLLPAPLGPISPITSPGVASRSIAVVCSARRTEKWARRLTH